MLYFAYASNLNKKQLRERCPDSKPRFTATLPNYKLVFLGWSREWRGGKASIRIFRGEKVLGAIYDVSEQCLRQLDKYESSYDRLKVTVFTETGGAIPAVTYIKTGQVEETKPSPEYLAIIQQGYRDWGIV
ncbi:MAG: gamma-glutamylcyclotransferase [Dehalococcoidales bacterium]|nr:gamma-glutamylcyclotransferase [Dehalococcoidales bacterium]